MTPFPDPIALAQSVPWGIGLSAALAAYPAWRGTVRLIEAAEQRWGDGARTGLAALALSTFGGLPAAAAMLFVIGIGADAVAHITRPRCIVERFMPDGPESTHTANGDAP